MNNKRMETLEKILRQEARLGYKDKAVLGGFRKLAVTWGDEALKEAGTEQERARIKEIVSLLSRYSSLASVEERKALLEKIHELILTPILPAPAVQEPGPCPCAQTATKAAGEEARGGSGQRFWP
jgi:hypothetical protein